MSTVTTPKHPLRWLLAVALTLAALRGAPASAADPANTGRLIGRYVLLERPGIVHRIRLLSLLGHGAMSETYRGIATRTRQEVAVKIQRDEPHAQGRSDGFDSELHILSHARAPQLTAPYGLAELEGPERRRALVLELAPGKQLNQEAWKQNWTVGDAVRVTQQILRGVDALHQAGFRHNDVNPNNVTLVGHRAETVKLLDVGHARRIQDPLRGWPGPTVAPERVLWHEVPSHGRVNADVYAAAATLAILLTGIDLGAQRERALAALPTREAVVGTTRVRLRDVIARGLDPDPARRYQSAQELIEALTPFASAP